jgi:putative phosphoribosyl transferase
LLFEDRVDAGQRLAEELNEFCKDECNIIGIPRGGAIIACQIAKILKKPWDIIIPRKIGSPFNKEIAIGAVVQDGSYILNDNIVDFYNISKEYIVREVSHEIKEIKRRLKEYKKDTVFPDVNNKTVILVDDGIATGYTAAAAVISLKKHSINKIIFATPVASVEALDFLKGLVDEVLCLEIPKPFISVGGSYIRFEQNTDNDIINLFNEKYSNKMLI